MSDPLKELHFKFRQILADFREFEAFDPVSGVESNQIDPDCSGNLKNVNVQLVHALCGRNKLNIANAFDFNVIEKFAFWIEKKGFVIKDDDEEFQKINAYLEVSEKMYSYRVDGLSDTANKIVQNYKNNFLNKILNMENKQLKLNRPKKPKLMLTSSDKLNKEDETDNLNFDPATEQKVLSHSFKNLFESNIAPVKFVHSLYYNHSLNEQLQKPDGEKSKNDENYFCSMPDVEDQLNEKILCSEFDEYVSEKDIIDPEKREVLDKYSDPEHESFLEGIEDHYVPEFENLRKKPKNCYDIENDDFFPGFADWESDLSPKNKTQTQTGIDGLLHCVDDVSNDFSFFNPRLLANWNGPKSWKTQAMVKALKSSKPSKQKILPSLTSPIIILDDDDGDNDDDDAVIIDEKTLQKSIEIEKEDTYEPLTWYTREEIDKNDIIMIQSKETLLPHKTDRWNANKLINTPVKFFDLKHKSEYLNYSAIEPHWLVAKRKAKKKKKKSEKNAVKSPSKVQDDDNHNFDNVMPDENDESATKNNASILELHLKKKGLLQEKESILTKNISLFEELSKLNDTLDAEYYTEDESGNNRPVLDIEELKKEISIFIDQECIEADSKKEWSGQLLFSNLINLLKVEEREELTISIVFVGLLHLANERSLKLIEEPSSFNGVQELGIYKSMNEVQLNVI